MGRERGRERLSVDGSTCCSVPATGVLFLFPTAVVRPFALSLGARSITLSRLLESVARRRRSVVFRSAGGCERHVRPCLSVLSKISPVTTRGLTYPSLPPLACLPASLACPPLCGGGLPGVSVYLAVQLRVGPVPDGEIRLQHAGLQPRRRPCVRG